jgi:uncharacterized repeat protein (TIGR03847 family)
VGPRVIEDVYPDHLVIDAVGEPGARTFYLQARAGERVITLKTEKEQVVLLGEKLVELLDLLAAEHGPDPVEPRPQMHLHEPIEIDFEIGTMALGYDRDRDLVVLQCAQWSPAENEPGEDDTERARPELRFWMTRTRMRSLAYHAIEVAAAGRPACELCGFPKGADHVCARTNGQL